MEMEKDFLYINSCFQNDRPQVYWEYNLRSGLISLSVARKQADLIFQACAIAEAEIYLLRGFNRLTPSSSPKGFGKKQQTSPNVIPFQLLRFVRKERPPLPDGIRAICGLRTQKALVEFDWYGETIQLETEAARSHAFVLIQAADASESDAFFRYFLQDKLDIGHDGAIALIHEFQEYRNRTRLEDLLNR